MVRNWIGTEEQRYPRGLVWRLNNVDPTEERKLDMDRGNQARDEDHL